MSTILFRADASTDIGTGHVMRCLALAQALHDAGHRTVFAMRQGAEALHDRLEQEGCAIFAIKNERGSQEDALETVAIAKQTDASVAVIDGYAFDALYQQALRDMDLRFLYIDDYGQADTYCADIILNQNSYAQKLQSIYGKRASRSELLLGSEYLLLRREYLIVQPTPEVPDVVRNVLVTFGGGDSGEIALRIANIFADKVFASFKVTMLVGAANPHVDAIKEAATNMHVIQNTYNMPGLLAQTDLAIAAGGTTSYELAYMGVPSLLFILAENQRVVAEDLHARGITHMIGEPDTVTDEDIVLAMNDLLENADGRKDMIAKGRELIDGKGAQRVVEALQSIS